MSIEQQISDEDILMSIEFDQKLFDRNHGTHWMNICDLVAKCTTRQQAEQILEVLKTKYPRTTYASDVVGNWENGIQWVAEDYATQRDPSDRNYRHYFHTHGLIPEKW